MEDYRLEQTGQEVQRILNGAAMEANLQAEVERATEAEGRLQGNIDVEEQARQDADSLLQQGIDDEAQRAKDAEEANAGEIEGIKALIPSTASDANKLADTNYVNSSIQTATAEYRGDYNVVTDLHLAIDATHAQIETLLPTVIAEADKNDYCYVMIPTNASTPTEIAKIERYKMTSEGWKFEYDVNNSTFTAEEWAAIKSGITSGLVAKLNALPTNADLLLLLAGKQDVLTFDSVPVPESNNPVKSGGVYSAIDDEKTARMNSDAAIHTELDGLQAKVPATASSDNKLVDQNQMNSSISTATATFRGDWNVVSDLHLAVDATRAQIAALLPTVISTADNNDYCYVEIPTNAETPTQIERVERYKFNGTAWGYEYVLNNSGFTADQWAAINSMITSGLVAKLSALPTNADLLAMFATKQDVLTFDSTPTENSTNPVTSGGVFAADKALSDAIEAILLLIPSAASALNKLVDTALMNSSISTATATFRGTYNLVSDLGLGIDATEGEIAAALLANISTADNNDYAFVQIPTSAQTPAQIARTDRYKFNGTAWAFEYTLNTSGFTAAQWAAINSTITSALVAKLNALPTAAELQEALGVLTSGITAINQKIPSTASQANKLVDNASMESYIAQVINILDASFNVTSTDGHITLHITQVDGKITAVQVQSTDIASAADLALKANQADLTALASRVTTAEGNITSLTGRMGTAETNIVNLQQLYNDLQQSKPVPVTALPSTGQQQGVIYRLAGTTSYSDYMWNGSTWVLMATYNNAIDPRPKKASQNLVTSGGVFDNMGALDVSELNATENPHTLAQYADLSAALAAIPTDYQKGGMSIKFVHTYDNKYVQARCMAQNFTTDVTQWQGVDDEPTAGSNNLVKSSGVLNAINIVNKEVFNFLNIPVTASGYVPCAPWNEPINKDYVVTSDVWNHNVLSCNAGDTFKISGLGGGTSRLFAFIDNNGNLCGEENIGYAAENFVGDNIDITAPANSAYLIVNFDIQHHPTGNNLKKLDISSSKIPEKVDIKKGWNLFNPEDTDVAIGYFIYNSSGVLSGGGTVPYNTSGYIPVTPSTTYYKALNASKGFRFVLCYNANKEAISSSFINDDCNSFTTPENAAYVRITFYQSDYDYAQIASEEKVYQQYSEIGGYLENIQNIVTNQGVQIGIIKEKCADGTTVVTKTDTNGSQFLPSDFGLTKFEKGTILEVYGTTDSISFMFYGNRGSGNEQIIGYISQDKYYPSSIVLEHDYVSLSSYSDNSTRTKTAVSLQSKLSYANDAVNRIKDGHSQNVFQSSKSFTSSGSETIQPSIFGLQKFEKGLTLEVYGETDGTTLILYGNRGSGNEMLIGRVSRDANKPSILTLEDDYNNLVYYSNSATQISISISIYGKSSYVDKEIQDIKDSLNGHSCKVLYIGDSYTEMARWTTEFEKMVNVSEKLNLGVSSADLKDIQSDITAYPYGSRPYNGILGSDGTEGNLNVFSSQIEQLKRIKAGNLHGILWKSVFSAPSANGTITFAFTEGTKTVNVLSTDSASDVAEKVAQISTSDYIITHPSGQNYVAIEALANSVDSIPTISSSVVTISSGILKYKESYPFTSNPDVVIIAGGKNDLLDTDVKVESYQSQVVHQENVYYKRSSEQSSTQGTIYVPTSASDVDRTCFCGSLRHLMEEIHSLYEDALIIVVGPSNLNYGGVNIDNDMKKDEQLSTAASYLSIPYISWFKNGIMCNRVFNKPSGSGTLSDPYILDSETDYTIDMMHPNYAGGKYLANNVAIIVKSYINNLI